MLLGNELIAADKVVDGRAHKTEYDNDDDPQSFILYGPADGVDKHEDDKNQSGKPDNERYKRCNVIHTKIITLFILELYCCYYFSSGTWFIGKLSSLNS